MKKILLSVIVVLSFSFIFVNVNAQSSKELLSKREKEIKKAKKAGASPTEIEDINAFYAPFIEMALTNEKTPNRSNNKTYGSAINFEGRRGTFNGGSMSLKNGADAYATVILSESTAEINHANARLINKMADNLEEGGKMSAPDLSLGLEGIIINRYRYQELTVTIVGLTNSFEKTYLLRKGESVVDHLLPGRYRASVKGANDRGPGIKEFEVSPHKTDYAIGTNVFWHVAGGSSW